MEIAGPLGLTPPPRFSGRLGVFEFQPREIARARHGHPIKRSRPHQPKMFALGPEESGAERTQQPLVASGHQKVGTELVDIHGYCPAALADVQRSEEHTSELQSLAYLVCRLLLEKKKHP